jgi:DHA2 family multidrug resistance protein
MIIAAGYGIAAFSLWLLTLPRNLRSSFGISMIVTILARNIQISHADIASNSTSSSLATINFGAAAATFGSLGGGLLAMIDGEVNRQAVMIAYIDNFYEMFWLIPCFVPLTLLVEWKNQARRAGFRGR